MGLLFCRPGMFIITPLCYSLMPLELPVKRCGCQTTSSAPKINPPALCMQIKHDLKWPPELVSRQIDSFLCSKDRLIKNWCFWASICCHRKLSVTELCILGSFLDNLCNLSGFTSPPYCLADLIPTGITTFSDRRMINWLYECLISEQACVLVCMCERESERNQDWQGRRVLTRSCKHFSPGPAGADAVCEKCWSVFHLQ